MFKKYMVYPSLVALIFGSSFGQSVWTERVSATNAGLWSVTWTGNQLVAVGDQGTIQTSPDGVIWTARISGGGPHLNSVIWTGQANPTGTPQVGSWANQLVVMGALGVIMTSPDGITWTGRSSGTGMNLQCGVWTGSQFVVVGDNGIILTTPDGNNWTVRPSGTTNVLKSVTWTGNQLVAVGFGGTILTSPDGITWTVRPSGTISSIRSVIWTGSQLMAVGGSGLNIEYVFLSSTDGAVWNERTVQTGARHFNLYSVDWTGTQFVTVGLSGSIRTSPSGSTWTERTSGTTRDLYSVKWTGAQLVAVGGASAGTILTSLQDPISITPRLQSKNDLSLRLTPSQLFGTLPDAFGPNTHAAIYTVSGNKVIEVHAHDQNGGFQVPIATLARGTYFLEVTSPTARRVQSFSLMR